jgi:hypothetical protein
MTTTTLKFKEKIEEIAVKSCIPSTLQPSVRTNHNLFPLMQHLKEAETPPIVGFFRNNLFVVLDGNRRLKVHQLLGRKTIKALVLDKAPATKKAEAQLWRSLNSAQRVQGWQWLAAYLNHKGGITDVLPPWERKNISYMESILGASAKQLFGKLVEKKISPNTCFMRLGQVKSLGGTLSEAEVLNWFIGNISNIKNVKPYMDKQELSSKDLRKMVQEGIPIPPRK